MESLRYHKIRPNDLAFYFRLRDQYFQKEYVAPGIKEYLAYYLTVGLGLISALYRDIYNIYIFRDLNGNRVGFIHLSNLHMFKIAGYYKTVEKKYLEFYSVDSGCKGKKIGSSIIRAAQEKMYPNTRIFGIIKAKNQKALLSASRTGRKVYSTLFRYGVSVDELISKETDPVCNNISIRDFIHGIDEGVLCEIYRKSISSDILKIEDVDPNDYRLRFSDRLVSSVHKKLTKIIEDIFIIEHHKNPVMVICLKIFKKTGRAECKIIGDPPSVEVLNYVIPKVIMGNNHQFRYKKMEILFQQGQENVGVYLNNMKSELLDEYKMVCNYEKFM